MEAVALAASASGARFLHPRLLKLDPHVKEFYFAFLLAEFPALLETHRALYARGVHADKAYAAEIDRRVERVRRRYRFDAIEAASETPEVTQMTLSLAS
jgi:hypothetical protein